jgi:hypothetical protein
MSYRAWRPGFDGLAVRASLGTPKWIGQAAEWPFMPELAPEGWYFRAEPAKFERLFIAQLERYGARHIARRLHEIGRIHQAGLVVVCCFEAERDDCHRGMWADWWLTTTGEVVTEITL